MNKLTLLSLCFLLGFTSLDAADMSCEIKCFFECMTVTSPCKTDNCPCPASNSTGNSTSVLTSEEKSSTNTSESLTAEAKSDDDSVFSLKTLTSLFSSFGSSNNAVANETSGTDGSSYDYSQHTQSNNQTKTSGTFDYSQYTSDKSGSPTVQKAETTNKTSETNSSTSFDYSAYNTEPATIPSNPSGPYNYSDYYQQPSTIPKGGA